MLLLRHFDIVNMICLQIRSVQGQNKDPISCDDTAGNIAENKKIKQDKLDT